MNIGLILAKGHSSRLPGKNIRELCGLPLFVWSVIQSKCSLFIDETYVTTDDDHIARLGEEHGAKIIWREGEDPDATAGVTFHNSYQQLKKLHDVDYMVTLLPTMPQRKPDDIDRTILKTVKLKKQGIEIDAMVDMAVMPENLVYRRKGGKVKVLYMDKKHNSCTDASNCAVIPKKYLETQYPLSGYDGKIDKKYLTDHLYLGWKIWGKTKYRTWRHAMEREIWQTFDIDVLEEFEFVELLMEHYILKGRGAEVYYEYKRNNT